jgi:hypothetical protein
MVMAKLIGCSDDVVGISPHKGQWSPMFGAQTHFISLRFLWCYVHNIFLGVCQDGREIL